MDRFGKEDDKFIPPTSSVRGSPEAGGTTQCATCAHMQRYVAEARKTLEDLSRMNIRQKSLQRTIASMKDDWDRKFSAMKDKMTCMTRVQNLNHTAILRLDSSKDMRRVDRTWDPDTNFGSTSCLVSSSFCLGSAISKFDEERINMLSKHGKLEFPQKFEMLVIWSQQRVDEGSQESKEQRLLAIASEFLQRILQSDSSGARLTESDLMKARKFLETRNQLLGLGLNEMFSAVIEVIPDNHWLPFARAKLRLQESVIRRVKCTCQPTPEQLYQILLTIQGNGDGNSNGGANEASM